MSNKTVGLRKGHRTARILVIILLTGGGSVYELTQQDPAFSIILSMAGIIALILVALSGREL